MKRKVPVAVAKGILARVPFHVSFWLCTNESLRSLADVSEALQKATDDVFRYHVNRDKNDFEVWIRDVIKDKDLAREIARVKTRETLIRKISERVEELTANVKKGMKPKSSKARKPAKSRRKAKRKSFKPRRTSRSSRVARRFAKKGQHRPRKKRPGRSVRRERRR
ncbi:hypothetical protein HYU20_04010 [Candidatus Woesearchaeota archaeon]|nr:hypothetical protein [Candidatus Woesearchaeota archaeon]